MRRALAVALILIVGCAAILLMLSRHAPPPERGSLLRVRLNADIASSDPAMKRDANTDAVTLHVVEGLVAAREDGTVGPMLARSWTISPDGRTYRFLLRRGVRFHNGARLTSADVVWSFRRYLARGSQWRCKADLSAGGIAPVRSVAAAGPQVVVITIAHAAPLFLTELARTDCAEAGILQRASIGPGGKWRYPIGTGPFRWGSWRHNQYVELLAYRGYRSLPGPRDGNTGGKRALVDRVRFVVIPDSSSAVAALQRGSLDLLDELPANQLSELKGAPGLKFSSAPSLDSYCILLQVRDPVLADVRLRRALALSLDVAALTRVTMHSTATPDSSPIPAASPYFGPAERPLIRRDLAEARMLVKAVGYHGQPIRLITSRIYPGMFEDAILIQAMAREAGINIEIETLDWATELARYNRGNYQAMVFAFSARLDPSLMLGVLIGDKAKAPSRVWDSAAAEALLHQSMVTADPRARQAIFDRIERLFRQDVPAIILYNTRRVTAMRDAVHGYRNWPAQTLRLWNVSVDRR